MAAKGGAQRGVGFQAVEHGLEALGRRTVAPVLRAQYGDQAADQFQGIGCGVTEAVQGVGHRVAGRRGLAEQPMDQCSQAGHVYYPFW